MWVYSQDPLSPDTKKRLLRALKKAKKGTPVINHPDVYNSYHEERAFEALAEAGVNVPRVEFVDADVGKTLVVYKAWGQGSTPKFLSEYHGPRPGYRVFEFVDSRSPEGLYRKYRVYYVAGIVRQSAVMFSDHWNVYGRTVIHREYAFPMPQSEIEQIRSIADTLGLRYFAVDYLRRRHDDLPVFVDINVYPEPFPSIGTGRQLGYYGRWHNFDTYGRLGIPEPSGRRFWDVFDEAMLSLSSNAGRTAK